MRTHAILAVLSLSALAAGLLMSCSDRSPTDPRSATQTTAEAAATATAATATTASTATSSAAAIEKPTYEAVFAALTRCTWTTRNPDPARRRFGGDEYITSEYNADGTYIIQGHSDYTIAPRKGRWNLAYGPPGAWYVCLDDGARHQISLLADGRISWPVFPDKPLPAATAAAERPPVQLPPAILARIDQLTAHTWKRANDLDLNIYPVSVTFTKDFDYVSTYHGVPAPNRGSWHATLDKIQGLSPTIPLADRAKYGGEQIDVDLLDDGNVLIGGELYVPKETPVTRGTIWAMPGYSRNVRVHVKYDMPVRKGIPCRFDVTITNLIDNIQEITLQRFSVTREGTHQYRRADKTLDLSEAKELAALDLGQVVVPRGQSKSFSLMVTFPESGSQHYYLNAMVLGITQAWDNHQGYTFDIHE